MALFGMVQKDDVETRQILQLIDKYNKKLELYDKLLARFNQKAKRLENVISEYESNEHSTQMDNVNLVLDLKYIKEQGDAVSETISDISDIKLRDLKRQTDANSNMLHEVIQRLDADSEEQVAIIKRLQSNRRLFMTNIFLQIAIVAGIIVMLLKMFDIIVL